MNMLPTSTPRPAGGATGWWWAAAMIAAGFALIGLLAPRLALPVLVITAIALALTLAGAMLARWASRVAAAPRSECAPAIDQRPPQPLPHHIARIVPEQGSDNPPMTPGARVAIVTVATERLWARHGLNLHDPAHHDQIRQRCSPDLWRVIHAPQERGARQLLHRHLGPLVDELEGL